MSPTRAAVLAETRDAPWLPAGSLAEVIRAGSPAGPTGLVRLLLHDAGRIFCLPREGSGKLDLPTRRVARGDHIGNATISALTAAMVGFRAPVVHLGYVRNTVAAPPPDGYEWPVPQAHFSVWTCAEPPAIDGEWMPLRSLSERHWFPLAQDYLS